MSVLLALQHGPTEVRLSSPPHEHSQRHPGCCAEVRLHLRYWCWLLSFIKAKVEHHARCTTHLVINPACHCRLVAVAAVAMQRRASGIEHMISCFARKRRSICDALSLSI